MFFYSALSFAMFLGGQLDLILGVLNGHIKYFPPQKIGQVLGRQDHQSCRVNVRFTQSSLNVQTLSDAFSPNIAAGLTKRGREIQSTQTYKEGRLWLVIQYISIAGNNFHTTKPVARESLRNFGIHTTIYDVNHSGCAAYSSAQSGHTEPDNS